MTTDNTGPGSTPVAAAAVAPTPMHPAPPVASSMGDDQDTGPGALPQLAGVVRGASMSTARIRDNLLDVDSIRGATAFNTEPAKFSSVLWQSALKVLFFPMAFHWWRRRRRLHHGTFLLGSFLYVAQGMVFVVVVFGWPQWLCKHLHFLPPASTEEAATLRAEVTIPVVLWLFCALAYGHLCAVSQSDGGKKKRRVPLNPLLDQLMNVEHKETHEDKDELQQQDDQTYSSQAQVRRGSFSPQPHVNKDKEEKEEEDEEEEEGEEEEEEEEEEGEEVLDDDEDAYHREEPFSEDLQEQEKVLLKSSSSRVLLQQLPSPKPSHDGTETQAAAPAAKPDATTTTTGTTTTGTTTTTTTAPPAAAAASLDDEEGMLLWGLGANGWVTVTLFNSRGEGFKVPMTLTQLRRRLVERAATSQQDWVYRTGVPFAGAVLAALVPVLHQLWVTWGETDDWKELSFLQREEWRHVHAQLVGTTEVAVCTAIRALSMGVVFFLAAVIFRQLAVTELTFKRRYKYSKLFSMLTSQSKAQRYAIPHFTLKNPLNIKMWMALRAGRTFLRRYEAQRLADTVVSSTFRNVVLLLTILCIEVFLGKDKRPFLTQLWHWELLVWGSVASVFLLRYFSLGSRINEKYHDPGVLLTESINIQLRIFENSCRNNDRAKREKLQISANVLKLAVKLLKELDSPTLINGLAMSPTLVRVTRVILVSALSAVVSDQFGFKLRLKFLK